MKPIAICVAIYLLGMLSFYPKAITVSDESRYVQQAGLFAKGETEIEHVDPLNGSVVHVVPSRYAPGTSALMTPAVAIFGWRGAFMVPAISVALAVLVTGLWMQSAGLSPLWALFVLSYPPSLVMGRVAMSDAPSMAAVALGMWLFWRGISRGGIWWFGAGLVAALSALLRDTNVILFAPLFIGSLLRREGKSLNLILGGMFGLLIWLTANLMVFGTWFNRVGEVSGGMSLAHVVPAMSTAGLALLIMIPGGLIAGFVYRGPRYIEVRIGIAIFVMFHMLWWYSGQESGIAKGAILGGRLYMPLIPILAFAAAFIGRGWTLPVAVPVSVIAMLALIVHPVMDRFGRAQAQLAELIYGHTSPNAIVITNTLGTGKCFDDARGIRQTIDFSKVSIADAQRLISQGKQIELLFLYRNDSDFWQAKSLEYDNYISQIREIGCLDCSGTFEIPSSGRLVIFKVGGQKA